MNEKNYQEFLKNFVLKAIRAGYLDKNIGRTDILVREAEQAWINIVKAANNYAR